MAGPLYLITGAGGGTGGVSRQVIEQLRGRGGRVRALVHRDDARANPLRDLGAEVVVADLTEPRDVVDAIARGHPLRFKKLVELYQDACELYGHRSMPVGLHAIGYVGETELYGREVIPRVRELLNMSLPAQDRHE